MARFFPKFSFKKKAMDLRYSRLLPKWRTTTDAKWYEWRTDRAIREGLKSSTYVYACINIIAKSVASVPWYVYRQNRNGDWIQQQQHPLASLIDRPTPWHSRKDLMTGMIQHLYLGGNSLHTKVRAGGAVVELWQLQPDWIKVFPSATDWIDRYEYNKDGIITPIDPKDIMHNKFLDPANPYWGLAPLQAGARAVDIDVEAVRYQKVGLQNMAISDGVFTFDHPLTQDQWNEARAMVREQHQGIDNAHTPWVLGAGANWQQMSMTPKDIDFIESRKFTANEICSIFQVPPPMIGILDKANYNNIETARKIFWLDTIVPLLEDIKDSFNLSLTPEFGAGLELSYDISNVNALQESTADKITQAKDLWAMGVPFNMINQKLELGFDDIDGGDQGFLGSGLQPLSALAVTDLGNQHKLDNPELVTKPIENGALSTDPENQKPTPPQDGQTGAEDSPKAVAHTKVPVTKNNKKSNAYKGINLKTAEQKDMYADEIHKIRARWITEMKARSADLFEKEAQLVAKDPKAYKKIIKSHEKEWQAMFKDIYQAITVDIGKDHYDSLHKCYTPRFYKDDQDWFDPYTEIIEQYILTVAGTKVAWVSDWTRQVIGALVMENEQQDGTMDDLAKAIQAEYGEFSRYRAFRIARTETQNALGFAQYQAGHQAQEKLGVQLMGEWWTSLDDRVRQSHQELHGEKRPLGEAFSNGLTFAGQYENDKGGHNNINCRCVILHHFE
jgi:HK97 family phage portal protein